MEEKGSPPDEVLEKEQRACERNLSSVRWEISEHQKEKAQEATFQTTTGRNAANVSKEK